MSTAESLRLLQKFPDGGAFFFAHGGKHFEFFGSVPRHDARRRGGFDAAQSARMRHDHALHVLHDVAARLHRYFMRRCAQKFARARRRVGDGDGLGAPHRGQKFFF